MKIARLCAFAWFLARKNVSDASPLSVGAQTALFFGGLRQSRADIDVPTRPSTIATAESTVPMSSRVPIVEMSELIFERSVGASTAT